MNTSLKKCIFSSSESLVNTAKIDETAMQHIDKDMTITHAIATLEKQHCYYEVIQLLAHLLPVREAILWGSQLLQKQAGWNKTQNLAIASIQDWVISPHEEMRQRCFYFINKLTLNCPPSWLAQAVFWNGSGSIVEKNLPTVLPDPILYSKCVAGAINLTAALIDQHHLSTPNGNDKGIFYQLAIKSGLDIAQGNNGMEENN